MSGRAQPPSHAPAKVVADLKICRTDLHIGATVVSDLTRLATGHVRTRTRARARACMHVVHMYMHACPASPLPSCYCEQPLSTLARSVHTPPRASLPRRRSRRTTSRTLCRCPCGYVSGVSARADPLTSSLASPTSTLSNLWLQKLIKEVNQSRAMDP